MTKTHNGGEVLKGMIEWFYSKKNKVEGENQVLMMMAI
jgi:hypothetical protein